MTLTSSTCIIVNFFFYQAGEHQQPLCLISQRFTALVCLILVSLLPTAAERIPVMGTSTMAQHCVLEWLTSCLSLLLRGFLIQSLCS